jgi:hypothetical protein
MRALTVAVFVTSLAMIPTIAGAQAKPDFTGRWTTDPDPAAAAPTPAPAPAPGGRGAGTGGRGGRGTATMGSGWGSTITIAQDSARLTVEYAFFGRGDMQAPLKFTYVPGGSPTRNSVMMGRGIQEQTSHAVWEGDKLAITTTSTIPNPAGTGAPLTIEIKQVLSLESPASLVVETTRAGFLGGSASTTRTVYRKL